MRIGVSGIGGFVGQVLAARLAQAGHAVVPIVRQADTPDAIAIGDLAAPILPDSPPALDAVVHLAARTHMASEAGDAVLAAYRAVNVDGTAAMLDLARRAGARRFLFLSSIKVNGERTRGAPFTERDDPRPEDAYGISKREAEDLIRDRAPEMGMDFVILRPPLIYGAGQKGNLRLLETVVRRGIPLPLASVHNRRSMIHVGNLADLIAVAIEHPRAANRTLLADDGTILATPALIRRIAAATGGKARLLPFPPALLRLAGRVTGRADQVERLTGDLAIDGETTRTLLHWQPPALPDQAIAASFAAPA